MTIITDDCIGCGFCAELCHKIELKNRRAYVISCANCDPCSIIEYDCPGGAIKLKEMET